MKLSVIIPFMAIDEDKYRVLKETTDSFVGADEIIVWSNWMEGYAKPINRGLRLAKGDFLMITNDDMTYDGGSLKRLCDPDAVTSPMVNGKVQEFWGCSFVLPRWVYEKIGGMYEGYEISYYDDHDLWETLKKEKIPMRCVDSVRVETAGGRTLDRFPNRNEFFDKNRQHFIERWGYDPTGSQQYA